MAQFYRDRLRGFGLTLTAHQDPAPVIGTGPALVARGVPEIRASPTSSSSILDRSITAGAAMPPSKTPQEQAEEDLERLTREAELAEQQAAAEAAGDPGAPTPWGLYVGIGVGALALIGGATYLIKRKKAKLSGRRRRR